MDSHDIKLVLRFSDAQVVSLLGADFLASKDIGQSPHVGGSITI